MTNLNVLLDQVKHMPRYTEKGYLKTKIPPKLYAILLDQRSPKLENEPCNLYINCVRLSQNGTEGTYILRKPSRTTRPCGRLVHLG